MLRACDLRLAAPTTHAQPQSASHTNSQALPRALLVVVALPTRRSPPRLCMTDALAARRCGGAQHHRGRVPSVAGGGMRQRLCEAK
jgi:hypothetical protein